MTVTKVDEGVAWGSVHWQYMEDISKITPHEGTPLKIKKALLRQGIHQKGSRPFTGSRTGRSGGRIGRPDRASHRPRHGIRSHEGSPRKRHRTGQRPFPLQISRRARVLRVHTGYGLALLLGLPAERDIRLRIFRPGSAPREYQTGMTKVQCMYAPEFNSHSQSIGLKVE